MGVALSHIMSRGGLRLVGVASTVGYMREPEINGCAERFVKTLSEQLLWIRRFGTVGELNQALQEFRKNYNRSWIIQHGYLTPVEARMRTIEREGVVS